MDYNVKQITYDEAQPWILKIHYAKRMPSISFAFGLFDETNYLIGVCTFGTPASSTLLSGVCGEDYKEHVIELNRLVLSEGLPKNTASYFVSRCIKSLPKPKIIVSYADTSQCHVGYVYQSTNFIYTGLSSKFTDPRIKGLEHQHHATYANGLSNKELKEKFGDRLYFVERARKHRYIYFHCCSKEIKNALRYPVNPYPKGDNKRYEIDDSKITNIGHLF